MLQVANPGSAILRDLFGLDAGRDTSAAIWFAGTTSATANTARTHRLPSGTRTAYIRNLSSSQAIAASTDEGASYVTIAAGASLLTELLAGRTILIKSVLGTGVSYQIYVSQSILSAQSGSSVPRTITVGPGEGYDFATAQDGVSAASAAYAATGKRQSVVCTHVALDFVPAIGVDVYDATPVLTRASGLRRSAEVPLQPIYLSFPGALIAIREDDIPDLWMKVPAAPNAAKFALGGVNRTPVDYAWRKGVFISHGAPYYYLDAGLRMSTANFKTAILRYGNELVCHSYAHGFVAAGNIDNPATYDDMVHEVILPRELFEAKTSSGAPATPGNRIGQPVNGFYQPGGWGTDHADNVKARLDNMVDLDSWVGRMIRANYEWSGTDHGYHRMGGAYHQHFSRYASIDTTNFDTLEHAKAFIKNLAMAGGRYELLIHLDATNYDLFKNAVDAIEAIRDDRVTYPRAAVRSVSASTLRRAVQPPATYDSQGALIIPHGQVYHDDWQDYPVGPVGTASGGQAGSTEFTRWNGTAGSLSVAQVDNTKASGRIDIWDVVADGDTVTVGGRVYEFDTNSSFVAGHVAVDVSGGVSAAQACAALAAAITGDAAAVVTATDGGDYVGLTSKLQGSGGNDITLAADLDGGASGEASGAYLTGGLDPKYKRQLVMAPPSGNAGLVCIFGAIPGRWYRLRFRAKLDAPHYIWTSLFSYYEAADDANTTEASVTQINGESFNLTADMAWYELPFFVPDFSNGHAYWQLSVDTGHTLTVDEVSVDP